MQENMHAVIVAIVDDLLEAWQEKFLVRSRTHQRLVLATKIVRGHDSIHATLYPFISDCHEVFCKAIEQFMHLFWFLDDISHGIFPSSQEVIPFPEKIAQSTKRVPLSCDNLREPGEYRVTPRIARIGHL